MRLIDADQLLGMLSKGYGTKRALDLLPTVDLWHYPSRGEFPPSGEEVLIRIDNKNYLGTYDGEVMWNIPLAEITCSGDWVDMWQYIEPPKEEA